MQQNHNRGEIVAFAEGYGWKPWGKMRTYSPGNDSKYQCFRRGREYCWIGNRYLERVGYGALDFVPAQWRTIRRWLQ